MDVPGDDFFGTGYVAYNPYQQQQDNQQAQTQQNFENNQQTTQQNFENQQTQQQATAGQYQTQLPVSTSQNTGINGGAGVSNTPAPKPQSYGFMEGVDQNKMNDQSVTSPKYIASRILASGGSLQDAAKAIGATMTSPTNMRLSTGEEIDTRRDEEGANALQWLVLGGGGGGATMPTATGGQQTLNMTPGANGSYAYNPMQQGAYNPYMYGMGGSQYGYNGMTGYGGNTGINGGGYPMVSEYAGNANTYRNAGYGLPGQTYGQYSQGGYQGLTGGYQGVGVPGPGGGPGQDYTGDTGRDDGTGTGTGTGTGGQTGGVYSGPMPPDLGPLREQLSNYLMGQLAANPTPSPYPGSLQTGDPWGMMAAYDRYRAGPDITDQRVQGIAGTFGDVYNQGRSLMQTGGMQDLNPYMDAIQKRSQLQMDNSLAQIKEQYGALGLGAGSDVSGALAQGAATGTAQMQEQMLGTALQASMAAGQNRVSAFQGMGNLAGQYGNLQLGQGQLWNQSAQGLLGVGALEQQVNEGNVNRGYQEYIRQNSPSPWTQAALGYATGFPPMGQSGGNGGAYASAGASVATALIIAAAMSDRNVKEEITPIDVKEVLKGVRSIDVTRWKYIKSDPKHMGPMAQDFKEMFGVGDGKVIMTVDAVGVLYGAIQALATKVEELEARLG